MTLTGQQARELLDFAVKHNVAIMLDKEGVTVIYRYKDTDETQIQFIRRDSPLNTSDNLMNQLSLLVEGWLNRYTT